ncbi:MAG: hypothetical protein GWN58_56685 [Anaerolineae bacterium]|nr:hypothetical protein [Anaerolineae bacterium]
MMSTRPPKPSKYHSWSREEGKWLTQGEVSWRRDRILEAHPSEYFDIEAGLDSPPLLLGSGTGARQVSLNALQARARRPMVTAASGRGSEWEELVSEEDIKEERGGVGMYYHYAGLIASQAFETQHHGKDRRASRTRLAWALHAQAVGEREIARWCSCSRYEIRSYLAELRQMILGAIDSDHQDDMV